MSLTNSRRLSQIVFGFTVCCVGSLLSAQEPKLPPIPNIEGLSQQVEIDAPPAARIEDVESEILTRGPVHEAFAEQYLSDPEEGLIVPQAPPELIDELPPEEIPEGTNVEWIPGYWAFDEDIVDYIWISGFWRDIPLGQRWVPGYWVEVDQGYQWVAGFWTSSEDEELSYLPTPPDSLEQGPNIAAPGDNYFWVPGCWKYESYDYRWRPGYWAPSYNDYVWMPARYQWTPRGYVHCTGYWDYPVARRGVLFSPVRFQNRRFPRRFRGYRHQPRLTVAAGPLLIHLFSRPRYRHYYFGDYYAARYRQRGIVPFTSVNRFSSRGYRYDPLFAYYQAGNRRTTFDRLVGWNRYFDQRQDLRPPRTFAATRDFARTRNRDVDQVVLNQTILSVSINDLKQSSHRNHKQFRVLSDDVRNRLSKDSLATVRKLTDQRIEFESKKDRGDRGGNLSAIGDRSQSRRDRVESLKLPDVVSLGSKLRSRSAADVNSGSRSSSLSSLVDRDQKPGDRSSRSHLERLKEQIEEKRRADRNGAVAGSKVDGTARSRESSNSKLADSIRERLEVTRQRQNQSGERSSQSQKTAGQLANGRENDPRTKIAEKILGANRTITPSQSSSNSANSRSDRSSQSREMRTRPSSGSDVAESIRERIEAARQRQNSVTDSRKRIESRSNQVEQKPTPKESKAQIVKPSRESDKENRNSSSPSSLSSLRERIEAARQRQTSSADPRKTIESKGSRSEPKATPSKTNNRTVIPQTRPDSKSRTSSGSFSASSLRERIEAARQRQESSRSTSKSSSSPSRVIDRRNSTDQRKTTVQPKPSSKEIKSRSDSRLKQPDTNSRSSRPQTSSSSKVQNDIRQRIEAARKAADAARKAAEAQRKRAASSSKSQSSRSNDIRSRSQNSQSRDSSSSRKAIQDALNRARQEAAKRAQQSSKRESSSSRSVSPSSRSKSASSIRSMIESRRSSSKSSSSREKPSKGSEKSKSKKK